MEEAGRAIPPQCMADLSEGEGEGSDERNRLPTAVQSKNVSAKLIRESVSQSPQQRNLTCYESGPALVPLIHSVTA